MTSTTLWWSRIDDESINHSLPEPERSLALHVLALQGRVGQLLGPDEHDRSHGRNCRCYLSQCGCAYDHPDDMCMTHKGAKAMDFELVRKTVSEVAQREYENSITTEGRVDDPAYLGDRIAAELLTRFPMILEVIARAIRSESKRGGAGHEGDAEEAVPDPLTQ